MLTVTLLAKIACFSLVGGEYDACVERFESLCENKTVEQCLNDSVLEKRNRSKGRQKK